MKQVKQNLQKKWQEVKVKNQNLPIVLDQKAKNYFKNNLFVEDEKKIAIALNGTNSSA